VDELLYVYAKYVYAKHDAFWWNVII